MAAIAVMTPLVAATAGAAGMKPGEQAFAVLTFLVIDVVAFVLAIRSHFGALARTEAVWKENAALRETARRTAGGTAAKQPVPIQAPAAPQPYVGCARCDADHGVCRKHCAGCTSDQACEDHCERCVGQTCRTHCGECAAEDACGDHCARCTDDLPCFEHCQECYDRDPCTDHCDDCVPDLSCRRHCDDCDDDGDCEAHVKARLGDGAVTYDPVDHAYVLAPGRKYVSHAWLQDNGEIRFVTRDMRPGETPETFDSQDVEDGGRYATTHHFKIRERAAETAVAPDAADSRTNGRTTEPA
jgi:hypothetical protein